MNSEAIAVDTDFGRADAASRTEHHLRSSALTGEVREHLSHRRGNDVLLSDLRRRYRPGTRAVHGMMRQLGRVDTDGPTLA